MSETKSKVTLNQTEDWYNTLSKEDKASIERGLDDLKTGRIVPHKVAMIKISEKISRLNQRD